VKIQTQSKDGSHLGTWPGRIVFRERSARYKRRAIGFFKQPVRIRIKSDKKHCIAEMRTLRYKIRIRPETDGTYTVIVPSLPGCLTFGHTIEEALEMAKEAIEVYIESLAARGKEIPIEEDQIEATVTVEANA
jgi:antitoxin HicB